MTRVSICSSSGIFTFGLVALMLLAAPQARAQAPECADNGEPHPYGTTTFFTNSRLGAPTIPGYLKSVRTCVTHNDPVNFLYVHWLIPGPDGWVPPGKVLPSLPRDTNVDPVSKLNGCLLYGNRGDTTRGVFIGVEGDDKRVNDEEKRGCRAAVANAQPSDKGIVGFVIRFLNYIPSNLSRPKETMLQLNGSVGIQPSGPSSYTSVVSYAFTRYEGSEGVASDLTVRPVFRGGAERLLGSFYKLYGEERRLGETGEIRLDIEGVEKPTLEYVAYEIVDRDRRPVGSIALPLFVSVQ